MLGDQLLGMGIGLLSLVTASIGFDLAIPNGNYFRILGDATAVGPVGVPRAVE